MNILELIEQKNVREPNMVSPEFSLSELAQLLNNRNAGSAVVKDEQGQLVGIVTERDLVRAISQSPAKIPKMIVREIMTRDIKTCSPEEDISDTLQRMREFGIRRMPVIEDGKLLSVIGIRDLQTICDHLGKLAQTDSLTGLANRREFMKAIRSEFLRYKRFNNPFSIAIVDIDLFKLINDEHGHYMGDMVLTKFADIFRSNLRAYDIAARIGGEEFGLLFPNSEIGGAVTACEKLSEVIRRLSITTEIGDVKCTASFGVTTVSPEIVDVEEILKYADKLLYEAKDSGRDKVVAALQSTQEKLSRKVA